jgi:hypothetical protein
LRQGLGLAVHAVGSDKALARFAIHGLGATRLHSLDDLRQIVRGERAIAGTTDWDVVHFLSHSNGNTLDPATSLRLGLQP